jgi:hypothetical protein
MLAHNDCLQATLRHACPERAEGLSITVGRLVSTLSYVDPKQSYTGGCRGQLMR